MPFGRGRPHYHYGLFAGTVPARNIARAANCSPRHRASTERSRNEADEAGTPSPAHRYPCCGGRMIIVETFLRREPRALARAEPDQDRHLMTVAALPAKRRFPSPPAARRSTKAMSSQRPQTLSRRRANARRSHMLALEKDRCLRLSPEQRAPPAPNAPRAFYPRPQNPHRSRPTKQRPFLPAVSPYEAFGRRPRAQPRPPAKGRRPKPFSEAGDRCRRPGARDRGNARARAVSRSWGSRIRRRSRSPASINSQTRPHFVRRRI